MGKDEKDKKRREWEISWEKYERRRGAERRET